MKPTNRSAILCILDGIGLNPKTKGNAVALANTPTLDRLLQSYPSSTLTTFGERVGLPAGQMGNSEVGHLNIGGGRVVEQWLQLIKRDFELGLVSKRESYRNFISNTSSRGRIHIVGLYSDGGVHSHLDHLDSLLNLLLAEFKGEIVLHLITDGRDTSPNAALTQLPALQKKLLAYPNVTIASISGRYYAMDRDLRWERTEKAYQAIAEASAPLIDNVTEYLKQSYKDEVTDEFLEPVILKSCPFQADDSLIFFNFRSDRMRQLCRALSQPDFSQFDRNSHVPATQNILCFTRYEEDYPYPFVFEPMQIKNHLGQVISAAGFKQLRIAETEKYPHVTYFLNGGEEEALPGESRLLVPSPREVATYDQKPEMSAPEVTSEVIKALESQEFKLIVVNFANGDMVGHTGVLEAAIDAVETVDACLTEVLNTASEFNTTALVIADHGNAEQMIEYDTGKPHTAHTTFPVPIILVDDSSSALIKDGGALCDVAPTLLEILDIPKPAEMTGRSLLVDPIK